MFFSTYYWGFALLWALIGSGIAGALAYTGKVKEKPYREGEKPQPTKGSFGIVAAIIASPIVLFSVRFCMYYAQPDFQGPFFGYGTVLWYAGIPAFAVGLVLSRFSGLAILSSIVCGAVLFLTAPAIHAYNSWGANNGVRFAGLPKIKTIDDPEAKIPPTDPDHLIMVTDSIAVFKGQTVLGSLGSKYKIDANSYTLQSVKGHRYWIAPLTLTNWMDTWNFGNPEAPGYVVVDAENPEADAVLKDGYHIRLFTDQSWGLNLYRYAYLNGYTDGVFSYAKFEVDDNWVPHWVIGYYKKAFAGVSGRKLTRVIVVNVAEKDPTITSYDPENKEERAKFAWVDRAMDRDLVQEYATDWGWYGGKFAQADPWKVWWSSDLTGTMRPADIELNYTVGNENVWVMPMQSTGSDHGVVGVLVYETNRNEATFYPHLKNFNVGETVVDTMFHAPNNVMKYQVEHVQLVSIYGELTWVAVYASPQKTGKSFGGIGLLHAHEQNSADVIFAQDKATALARYAVQVANRKNGEAGKVSRTVNQSKEVRGRIVRIAPMTSVGGGSSNVSSQTVWYFKVEGNAHTFRVSQEAYADIALVKEGDEVVFSYLEYDAHQLPVSKFACPAVDSIGAAPAPKLRDGGK